MKNLSTPCLPSIASRELLLDGEQNERGGSGSPRQPPSNSESMACKASADSFGCRMELRNILGNGAEPKEEIVGTVKHEERNARHLHAMNDNCEIFYGACATLAPLESGGLPWLFVLGIVPRARSV